MNKDYIIVYHTGNGIVFHTTVRAENNEMALKIAQGNLQEKWVSFEEPDRYDDGKRNIFKLKSDAVIAVSCEGVLEE